MSMRERKAINWNWFLSMFGNKAPPTPATPAVIRPLVDVFKAIADNVWEQAVLSKSGLIQAEIVAQVHARKMGQYMNYAYFLLFEQSRNWPRMSGENKAGLNFAHYILSKSGDVPEYKDFILPPDIAHERVLDAVLLAVAAWTRSGLKTAIAEDYTKVLARHTPEASAALGLPAPDAEATRRAFETLVMNDSEDLGHIGDYLWMTVTLLQS